jgi:hypothetical protein
MPELEAVQAPKTAGFVDRGYNYEKKRLRLEEEEKEIARLEAIQKGEEVEEDSSDEEVEKVEAGEQVEASTEEDTEENLTAEEKSFKKRYGDLRRHMQEKEKEWQDKFSQLENSMKNKNIAPPKSDEDIEKWAKKYPDVASIVETIAAKKAQEMFKKADERLQEFDKVQYEAVRTRAENQIRKAHPDFDKLRDSDDFHNWAEEQPKWVKDALYENADDAPSVIRIIDLYKVDKGLTNNDKKRKVKEAASAVSAKSNRADVDADESSSYIKESDVAKMSAAEFEKNADQINAAIRSGKFVYDISGNAR